MHPSWMKFRGRSLQITAQEKLILLTDLSRLVKGTPTLSIQTAKIFLNFMDVELKILTNEISKFLHRTWVVRNVGSDRRDAAFSPCTTNQRDCQDDSPRKGRTAQPEVSQTPYFLEYTHFTCLMGSRPQYSRST